MTAPLPPLPGHPEPHTYRWSDLEARAIEQYGAEVRRLALEHAARCTDPPLARMHPDGRVIPESTYAQAAADGGASWRAVMDYTIKLGPIPRQ